MLRGGGLKPPPPRIEAPPIRIYMTDPNNGLPPDDSHASGGRQKNLLISCCGGLRKCLATAFFGKCWTLCIKCLHKLAFLMHIWPSTVRRRRERKFDPPRRQIFDLPLFILPCANNAPPPQMVATPAAAAKKICSFPVAAVFGNAPRRPFLGNVGLFASNVFTTCLSDAHLAINSAPKARKKNF